MALRIAARPGRPTGFTLVELMVVVAIATILFAVAVPSYISYVRQSRRTEARTAVLDLAGREERYFSTNGAAYTPTASQLGYTAFGVPIGSGYYQLTLCVPASSSCVANLNMPNPPVPPSYTVVATPLASQVNDTQCGAFAVDSTGQQYAITSAGAANTAYCWSN